MQTGGVQQSHAFPVISRVLMPVEKTASVLCKEGPCHYLAQADNEASKGHSLKYF